LSRESSTCRCELRASRQLACALVGLGGLAVAAVFLSDVNLLACLLVAGGAMGWSLFLAWREWHRLPQVLLLGDIGQPASLIENGVETTVTLQRIGFRGSFVLLEWSDADARRLRRALWPDALPESQRRALRRRHGTGGDSAAAGMAG
jgi:hypothetical protein